ncbi:Hypothetical predicted protein [Cloeon dipterum]|uniref:Sushi domain-containing protein n=1 Tax=Cloeon dipterum TaxID=197152 RepID=A0A8S1DZN1_9INSE|nr:Hypothetical predicted protein [Cloeon dipterum]
MASSNGKTPSRCKSSAIVFSTLTAPARSCARGTSSFLRLCRIALVIKLFKHFRFDGLPTLSDTEPGCPLPGVIENGYWKTEAEHSVLKVFCSPDFEVHETEMMVCNGKSWSAPVPFCYPKRPSLTCDLSSSGEDLCGWQQDGQSSDTWTLQSKANPYRLNNTGPDKDDSPAELGKYLYLDNSLAIENKTIAVARLYSPVYAKSLKNCFSFSYHMFGSEKIGTIRVYIVNAGQQVSNTTLPKANVTGDQGDAWRQFYFSATTNTSIQWVIEAEIQDVENISVIAIDNMKLNFTDCPSEKKPEWEFPSCKNRCTHSLETNQNSKVCSCADKCAIEDNCCFDFEIYCNAAEDDEEETTQKASVVSTTTAKPRATSTATTRPTTVKATTPSATTVKTTATTKTTTVAKKSITTIAPRATTKQIRENKTTVTTPRSSPPIARTTINTTTQTTTSPVSPKPHELPLPKKEDEKPSHSGWLFWVVGVVGAVVMAIGLLKFVCGNFLRRRQVLGEDGEGVAFISNDADEPQLDFTLASPTNVRKFDYDEL